MEWRSKGVVLGFVSAGLLVCLGGAEVWGQVGDVVSSRRRARGAAVAPVFEGWEQNKDGTSTLYFGYNNRNWEEEVDIPVGPNNFFSPGPQDRGQPAHFLINRRKKTFAFVVPKEFDKQSLVWTLIRNGSTETVTARRTQLMQVDGVSHDRDDAAPTVDLGPVQTVVLPGKATLTAKLTSGRPAAGLPPKEVGRGRGRGNGADSALTVRWSKYRGPGTVTFENAVPPVKQGQAVTTATFSEPGTYVLLAMGDEGSAPEGGGQGGLPGFICCWSNTLLTVNVKAAP